MKYLLFGSIIFLIASCSSKPIRTKWADKNMRVALDADSVSTDDYVSIQTALVKEGRFMVIDRNIGYKAIKVEQERLHRKEEDRYSDKEKWAQWGKLYGVGAIVVAHSQCYRTTKFFSSSLYTNVCKQFLSLVDANTGEVISAVDNLADSPASGNNFGSESFKVATDWTEAVEKFVDAYPKDYKPQYYSEGIKNYQNVSEEEARRQRELVNEKIKEGVK